MDENIIKLNPRTEKFLDKYLKAITDSKKYLTKEQNDRIVDAALLYEKLRVAIEYQEEHLIFKNAIARILKRHCTLTPNLNEKRLVTDLVSELSWANYVNPESLDENIWKQIELVIRRYLILIKNLKSEKFPKRELVPMILGWCACEIDEIIKPKSENNALIDFAYEVLKKNMNTQGVISDFDNEIQLKIAINYLLLKPDLSKIQFWLINEFYPNWEKFSDDEIKNFGHSFDPFYNQIDSAINSPRRFRYLQYTKKYIGPFRVIRAALEANNFDYDLLREQPGRLITASMDAYNLMVAETQKRVWRGIVRALVFIFITKISLAFLLEVPFEKYFYDKVDWFALTVNVTLPPILMLVAGYFIKVPTKKNYHVVRDSIINILYDNKIEDKETKLKEEKAPSYSFFNFFYGLVTLGILYGAISLLLALHFNFFSIFLFFLFVSAVSFFSFRIRNLAQELIVKKTRDNTITSIVELAFLPFIRIGRAISNQLSYFNPFIIILDFLIEAPLKTIIRISNSWKRFISKKKEELEY